MNIAITEGCVVEVAVVISLVAPATRICRCRIECVDAVRAAT